MRRWVDVEGPERQIADIIRKKINVVFARIFPPSLKSEQIFIILVAVFIGLIGGLGATGFRYMIRTVQRISYGDWTYTLELVKSIPWYVKVMIPAAGGLVVGLIVYFFAREVKGHGVPEVMEAVALRGGKIRPRVILARALSASICIGTGGSTGREGPIVQIGAALGSTIGQFFKTPSSTLKTFVGCGAAAGIASAFNAPIAGAFFALEVIIGDFAVPQFAPIVISSVFATVVSHFFFGNYPAFIVPEYHLVSPWEFIPYVVLGICAALVGILFIKVLYRFEDFFDERKIPEYIKPLIGGLIIGAISLRFPEVLGTGYEAIDLALAGKLTSLVLFSLIFVKLAAVSITLGSGGSGGIFAPSLFLGAMTGGFVGVISHSLFPEITASYGAYALVGMGAVVAATTHAPLTAIIIIFEMTNDYSIILPLMIACIIGTVTAMRLKKESIYSMKLLRKKLNIFVGKELNILKSLYVKSVMSKHMEIVSETANLNSLLEQLVNSSHTSLFMVDENNQFSGIITMHDLRGLFLERDSLQNLLIARDIALMERIAVTPDDDLDYVMKLFGQKNIDELPVVESRYSRVIIGSIWRNKVMDAYNQEILRRDLIGELSGRIKATQKSPHIDLTEGYSMAEVEAPHSFVGKSLKEAEIRARFGIQIVLIKRRLSEEEALKLHRNEETIIPDASYVIQEGDIFLIMGNINKINNFKYIG